MKKPYYTRAFVYTTTACQFNCTHCFVREERKKFKPQHIDLQLVEQFMNDFGNPKYGGFKGINITGVGNPLLYPKLKELVALLRPYARDELSINCRGKIKDDILYTFKIFNVSVYYSMDYWGTRADEEMGYDGLWNEQLDTIKKMIKHGIKIIIRSTIMRDNFGDCLQLIRLVERWRLRGVNIEWHGMPYLPYVSDEKLPTVEQIKQMTSIVLSKDGMRLITPWFTCIFPEFRDRAKRWWGKAIRLCEAGRDGGRICLTHDGKVIPCPFENYVLSEYSKKRDKYVLNWRLFHDRINEYLEAEPPDYCNDCKLLKICKGGCRIHQKLSDKCICPKDLF